MRSLITFLVKNTSGFLFIFLEVICFYFVFQYNAYQRSVFLNSSDEVSGRVYLATGDIQSFFCLRKNNEELLAKNAELQLEVRSLRSNIHKLQTDSLHSNAFIEDSIPKTDYSFVIARVVNLSTSQVNNLIMIDKGSEDGFQADMGVLSQQGVAGKIISVSPHFSVIMPLINSESKLFCRVKRLNITGSLSWDGVNYKYAYMNKLSGNEGLAKGDTILTDYSQFFEKGLMVGTVVDMEKHPSDNSYTLKIKLATDYSSLNDVLVIKDNKKQERLTLEKKTIDAK